MEEAVLLSRAACGGVLALLVSVLCYVCFEGEVGDNLTPGSDERESGLCWLQRIVMLAQMASRLLREKNLVSLLLHALK